MSTTDEAPSWLTRLDVREQAVFRELEELMALNTLVDQAVADLPALWQLAGATGDVEALIAMIRHWGSYLPAPQREALKCLFTTGDGAATANLTGRKRLAVRHLGKPYNTARARRDGQPNEFDQLLLALLPNVDVESIDPDLVRNRKGQSRPAAGGRAPLVLWLVIGAILAGSMAAGIVMFATDNDSDPPVATATTAPRNSDPASPREGVAVVEALDEAQEGRIPGCDRPVGGPLVPTTDNVWISALMIRAYDDAVAAGFELGCPAATAQDWGDVWYQRIDGIDPSHSGTLVANKETATVFLPNTIWFAYFDIGLDGGESAQSLGGFPTDFVVDKAGHWIAHLSLGGIIITEQPNTSGRWLPQLAMPVWEEHGGIDGDLGVPMTNVEYVDGVISQTYEYGKAHLAEGGVVVAEPLDQAQIDADVADLSRQANGILSTYDGNDWWIDDEGVRHWIPGGRFHDDDALWECLGGLDSTIAEDLNGWVIAAFPLGDNASCPAS